MCLYFCPHETLKILEMLLYRTKAVNREDKLSRRYRDRDLAKFESSRRYRER
jgi:hypothetical protein